MRPPSVPTTIPINADDGKLTSNLKTLYNTLIEYRDPKAHRILIQLFMCLPSRKDFPAYYNIIDKPIAMNKIRDRIELKQYISEDECIDDLKLMFSNCKYFNEDNSQIYKDAVSLERILLSKRRELSFDSSNNQNAAHASAGSSLVGGGSSSNSNNNSIDNNHQSSNDHANDSINGDHVTSSSTDSIPTNNNSSPAIAATTTSSTNFASITNSSTTNNNNPSSTPSSQISPANQNNASDKQDNSMNNTNGESKSTSEQPRGNNHSFVNGNEDSESGSLRLNHNHHNETSMDSSSNLSADLLASTPVEKCSLNTRRGRNSDAPKRQLLTGYIIYASEIRKQVIDKNPNQNFGDISRLVGNEWKALPHDIRIKYDQRALIHNKRVRERTQRELNSSGLSNGLHTPKMTKRKLAKLAKEQMKKHHLSIANHDDSSIQSPKISQDHHSISNASQGTNSTYKNLSHQHSQPQTHPHAASSKTVTADSTTQTTAIRFVEPPTKKRLVYSESFKRYIEGLQVPNRESLMEETTPDKPAELPSHWLGAGTGRHESTEAALWALRDFMLQDAVTMRRSMEPYI